MWAVEVIITVAKPAVPSTMSKKAIFRLMRWFTMDSASCVVNPVLEKADKA